MNTASSGASSAGAAILIILVGSIALACYIAPGIVASVRKVPNAGSVWVLNLLLGWTIVGWAIALAMACRSKYQAIMTPYGRPYGQLPPPPPPGFRPPAPQPYGYAPERYQHIDVKPDREQGW